VSELRVGAEVRGADDVRLGGIDALIVDPTEPAVTAIVVVGEPLAPRRLLPVERIRSATPEYVIVDLDAEGFDRSERFDEPAFNVPGNESPSGEPFLEPGAYFLEPYATPLDGWLLSEHERIPKGEVSIRRGDEILSSDGTHVGHVDEFLVDPSDGHITHVVLRQGHVFRHDEDIVIPVGVATTFEEGRVILDIDLRAIEQLPAIPVQRHRHIGS
jgi:sporulation protein YlmC with PRC-barrel domain